MSNMVQIDPDVLIKAMTAAIQAAIVTKPTEKKRGRPKKSKLAVHNPDNYPNNVPRGIKTEIITVEEDIDQIVNEPLPQSTNKPAHGYIVPAKNNKRVGGVGVASAAEIVTEKRGQMKFVDIQNVGDKIPSNKYPEPSQRRPEKKKMHFTCDRCRCDFEMYPSEIPQAFMKEKIPTGGEDKPRVYCNDCAGIGK